ncbi:MAG: isoprenyl transferase [Flavobacteriales bacterium]
MSLDTKILTEKIPKHIAIIMDGNGRWAKKQSKIRIFGHRTGVKTVRNIVEGSVQLGVKYLTLFAFSSENWNRPKFEINALMELLVQTIHSETKTLNKNNVKLTAIGDIDNLPNNCSKNLKSAIELTKNNTAMTLVLALSYSSREEIISTCKKIARKVVNKELNIDDINENIINENLYTHNIPDPELLIRTSGEYRLSNFLMWQIAYSELHFTDVLWPEFTMDHLKKAIIDFQNRERRFGKTSEQIEKENA